MPDVISAPLRFLDKQQRSTRNDFRRSKAEFRHQDHDDGYETYDTFADMINQIAPQFFTMDIPATLAYYKDKLGFDCLGTWQDPPVYAIVARDHHRIHFRCAEPPALHPDKYADELLDAYLFIEDADELYAEFTARGVEFTRSLANTPWQSREFVVKDCDGRLLGFGASIE